MVDNPSGGKMCSSDRDPKVIFLRDCLNKVMRCGLVRRVVIQYLYWSIMIYITFMVKQDGFKKGHALHNWHNILFTSLVHTFKRGERPTFLPPFPFHQNAQVSSNLGCCSVRKQFFFLVERQNTRRRPSSFFFGLQLKWLLGHNAGLQLVQMSHKTKRRRRKVIDGKIITHRLYWRGRNEESKILLKYKLIQFL